MVRLKDTHGDRTCASVEWKCQSPSPNPLEPLLPIFPAPPADEGTIIGIDGDISICGVGEFAEGPECMGFGE